MSFLTLGRITILLLITLLISFYSFFFVRMKRKVIWMEHGLSQLMLYYSVVDISLSIVLLITYV